MKLYYFSVLPLAVMLAVYPFSQVLAQLSVQGAMNAVNNTTPSTAPAPAAAPVDAAAAVVDETVPFTGSLFFSPAEVSLIQQALKGSVASTDALDGTGQRVIPMRRTIALAGVVYKADDDWVVWLNGQKVTPEKLLPEIVDIQVENQLVHLKWFDIGINDVITITLRPHQIYDIVTGVLLPGVR